MSLFNLLLSFFLLNFFSCGKNLEKDEQGNSGFTQTTEPLIPNSITLQATRSANYDVLVDGTYLASEATDIQIPLSIDITFGETGNGHVSLVLNKDIPNDKVTCLYLADISKKKFNLNDCRLGINEQSSASLEYTVQTNQQARLVASEGNSSFSKMSIKAILLNQNTNQNQILTAHKYFNQYQVSNGSHTLADSGFMTIPGSVEVFNGFSDNGSAVIYINKENGFYEYYCLYKRDFSYSSLTSMYYFDACYDNSNIDIHVFPGSEFLVHEGKKIELEILSGNFTEDSKIKTYLNFSWF